MGVGIGESLRGGLGGTLIKLGDIVDEKGLGVRHGRAINSIKEVAFHVLYKHK